MFLACRNLNSHLGARWRQVKLVDGGPRWGQPDHCVKAEGIVLPEHLPPVLSSPESVSGLGEAQMRIIGMPAASVVSLQGADASPAFLKEKSC